MGDQVVPELVERKIWASGHHEFKLATIMVPGFCMSTPKPPKPK